MTRALLFTRTTDYRHDSIPASVAALRAVPSVSWDHSEDPASLHSLDTVNVVVFLSTSGDVLDEPGRAELRRFVEAGGGFAGIHCAGFTEPSWEFYGELLGARFAGHPEGVQPGVACRTGISHPSTDHLPQRWAFEDEWYSFTEVRPDLQVVLTVDEATYAPGGFSMPEPHPQAWFGAVGAGRSWFTALGHSDEAWADPQFLGHVVAGVRWAAGE